MCWCVEVGAVSIEVVEDTTAPEKKNSFGKKKELFCKSFVNIFLPAEVANDEPFETMTIGCFTDDLV